MSTIVRAAAAADLPMLVALDQACFKDAERWGSSAWAGELEGRRVVLVAVEADEVVGAISVAQQFETVDLLRVMVAPTHRRRRVAERLVHEALVDCPGATRVVLEVRHDNAAALMLYTRLGFRAIDRRPDYYGPGLHAVIMEAVVPVRELTPGGPV